MSMAVAINVLTYLQRINYRGGRSPTLAVLTQLQEHHVYHVAFENTDIHCGVPLSLDVFALFDKVVIRQRGGLCYELNSLFYWLLKRLGFNVVMVSAGVYNSQTKRYGDTFDHMALVVTIDGQRYLVDVGFGEFALHPLVIGSQAIQHDTRGDFCITSDGGYYIVSTVADEQSSPVYRFSPCARHGTQFMRMCQYHQTNPASSFTRGRLVSLATPTGRVTWSGNTLSIRDADGMREFSPSDRLFAEHLKNYFSAFM